MSAVQRMISEPQRELQQLRQDAKTDGLNVDALNLLVQVRSRSLPDGGARILNDLVEYAIGIGIQFDQVTPQHAWEQAENQHVTSNLPEEWRTSPAGQRLLDRIRFSGQLALGAVLSAAMLWYLQ
jgi:hypothetical protein